jgi:hypothetical protein
MQRFNYYNMTQSRRSAQFGLISAPTNGDMADTEFGRRGQTTLSHQNIIIMHNMREHKWQISTDNKLIFFLSARQ